MKILILTSFLATCAICGWCARHDYKHIINILRGKDNG